MATTSKYPYPANLNVANFVSLKLDSSNYLLWKTQVESLIESQELLGFITGDTVPAEASSGADGGNAAKDKAAWVRTDRLIKAWITANLSDEALGTVVGLTTSSEVWTSLANTYAQNSEAREFELLLKLQEKKKDTTSLNDFIKEFKATCDSLNAIGKPVQDKRKVFTLLSGLGPRYESFTTAMLKPPVPSYNDLLPLLYSHELRNKSVLSEQSVPSMAFVGQRSNPRYQHKRGHNYGFSSRGRGFHQSSSRNPHHQSNAHTNRPRIATPQSAHTGSASVICQICKKKNHEALKCRYRFDNSYQDEEIPKALAALHLNQDNVGEWITDTGATAHIADDAGQTDPQVDGIGE